MIKRGEPASFFAILLLVLLLSGGLYLSSLIQEGNGNTVSGSAGIGYAEGSTMLGVQIALAIVIILSLAILVYIRFKPNW